MTVAVAIDGNRERRRDHIVGTECLGEFFLVAHAVLRRDEHAFLRICDRFAQRLDRTVGVVRFGRDDRDVGFERRDRVERARRVLHLDADRTELIAQIGADRPAADDIDLHDAIPVLPKPPAPRTLSGSSSTTSKCARETGATTNCAMRSPRRIVTGADPKLARITPIGPR